MPINAVLLLRTKAKLDAALLQEMRLELPRVLDCEPDDFYPGSPLRLIRSVSDGPVPVDDGSVWYEVGLARSYYGEGYERGDLPSFIACAEWLERRVPGCEVWYGHDCADESIGLFGKLQREALRAYYDRVGHEPYDSKFRRMQPAKPASKHGDLTKDLTSSDFERILIIKPSSFGDVIHAMPVLHGLRARFPKARISWLVANSCAGLLEGHPDLDEVIRFDRRRYGRIGRSLGPTIEFVRFLRDLRSRRFDLVLDLQGLFRSGFMTLVTGARARLGFANAREFAPLFYTRRIAVKDPDMHAVDRNYLFARALGFGDLQVAFNMPVRAEAAQATAEVLAAHGIAPGQPYALMAPGTRWETKRWPAAGFAEIARRIRTEFGLLVVLIGMEDEVEVARQVEQAVGEGIVNLAGRTKLPELIALVAGAAMAVMHDSGPMHLATAFGRPIVAIYGPTSPSRTGPYGRPQAVARLDLLCSPCYIKRTADCPQNHRCMADLAPDVIMDRLRLSYRPGVTGL